MQSLSMLFLQMLLEKAKAIPVTVWEKARDCYADYLAVTEAGASVNLKRWEHFCRPSGITPLIGMDAFTDSKTACLINGYNAHSLELDDGQRFAMIHLGASIITAIEAARSEFPMSEHQIFTGIIMGYEAACRLALAMQPSHKKRGFHTAGTCGTIGAAIGTAFALQMEFQQMQTVLAAAVGSSAGMLELQEQNSELKPYTLGRAAMDGLTAAYMGFTDFLAPDDVLDGQRGYLKLFCEQGSREKMLEETEYFEIERIYVKPYAACRHCHSPIEAALALRTEADPDAIEQIEVQTYRLAVKGHDHSEIKGVASAKLSIPYCVAAAWILGQAGVSAFSEENVTREDILKLAGKVIVREQDAFSEQSPAKRIAKVSVQLSDGRSLSRQVDYAKGDPENPMSRDEIRAKAVELLGYERASAILKQVFHTL